MSHDSDFNLLIKVRNGRLLRKMREHGIDNAAQLARLAGVWPGNVGNLLNLKSGPILKNGEYSKTAIAVCGALNATPEEIWPEKLAHYRAPKKAVELELSIDDLPRLMNHAEGPEKRAIDKDLAQKLLGKLTPRRRDVITRRLGLGQDPPASLDEVAAHLGVSRERIRQIEMKALRQMRGYAFKMGVNAYLGKEPRSRQPPLPISGWGNQ